jgi:hypothetical protein
MFSLCTPKHSHDNTFVHRKKKAVDTKGADRPQETYQAIKVNGLEVIRGVYTRGADNNQV